MNDSDRRLGVWRVVQAAVLVLVAGLFLFSLYDLLNPLLWYGVLVVLLIPFRRVRGHALVITVATVLVLAWLLSTAGPLLAPFILAFVLAYVLDPLVDKLSAHRKVNRTLAICLILVPVLAATTLVLAVGLPALARLAESLVEGTSNLLKKMPVWAANLEIPFVDESALGTTIQELDAEAVTEFLQTHLDEWGGALWAGVLGLGRGLSTLFTVLGYLVLTPILTFYLLRDYDLIVARVGALLPGRIRPGVQSFFREYDAVLSRYLRGQVAVSLLVGTLTWLGLLLTSFPHAFLLGATVAVLGIVPYLGVIASLIPAVFIALAEPNVGISLIKVAAVYTVAQTLEGTVISPKIVGGSVGLHPVWILMALSLGGFFFGFVGLLIGVPLAAGVKLLVARSLARYRASALYNDGPEQGEAAAG